MPKLSIFMNDDVYSLVEKEIEENGQTDGHKGISQAISRLVKRGSPYEVVIKKEFRTKGE